MYPASKTMDYPYFFLLLLGILILFIKSDNFAQSTKFYHLTIEDGLSQNTVQDIWQDKHGFMWFCTQDGLNRYDGFNFEIFRKKRGDLNSISDNFITCIHEDKNGDLWIGTNSGGLNYYNLENCTFSHFLHDSADPFSISNNNIIGIEDFGPDQLLIATGNGSIFIFNTETHTFTNFITQINHQSNLRNNFIHCLEITKDGRIFLGTDGNGLAEVKIVSESEAEFVYHFNNFTDSQIIMSILEIEPGLLLIGTDRKSTRLNSSHYS